MSRFKTLAEALTPQNPQEANAVNSALRLFVNTVSSEIRAGRGVSSLDLDARAALHAMLVRGEGLE